MKGFNMSEIRWDRRGYTKEEFIQAFNASSSWKELAKRLNIDSTTHRVYKSFKRAAEALELDYSSFTISKFKYSDEKLIQAVSESNSFAGVLKFFDLKLTGGNYSHMSKRIKDAQLDISHFKGQGHNKGKPAFTRKTVEEVFILGNETDRRVKSSVLKRCMVEVGIDYVCNSCKIDPFWNGKELVLEINHINGNFWDNRQDNLEFLCPNCHSQEKDSNKPHKYRDKVKSEA